MKDPHTEIELQLSRIIDYLIAATESDTLSALGDLHAQILNGITAQMEHRYSAFEKADSITASTVVLQLQDDKSGRLYSRTLPLDYKENSNGLILEGENYSGAPSQIAFLSDTAINKINDITGHGANMARCTKNHK